MYILHNLCRLVLKKKKNCFKTSDEFSEMFTLWQKTKYLEKEVSRWRYYSLLIIILTLAFVNTRFADMYRCVHKAGWKVTAQMKS